MHHVNELELADKRLFKDGSYLISDSDYISTVSYPKAIL